MELLDCRGNIRKAPEMKEIISRMRNANGVLWELRRRMECHKEWIIREWSTFSGTELVPRWGEDNFPHQSFLTGDMWKLIFLIQNWRCILFFDNLEWDHFFTRESFLTGKTPATGWATGLMKYRNILIHIRVNIPMLYDSIKGQLSNIDAIQMQ